jgi:hypothetical protein
LVLSFPYRPQGSVYFFYSPMNLEEVPRLGHFSSQVHKLGVRSQKETAHPTGCKAHWGQQQLWMCKEGKHLKWRQSWHWYWPQLAPQSTCIQH